MVSRIILIILKQFLTKLGWWLAKNGSQQGWAPSAYVAEQAPPPPPPVVRPGPPPPPMNGNAARGKPAPPAPPAKRPSAAGRKPAPPAAPRDSGLSMNGSGGSGTDSGRNTPTPSLAGGLAEALRARQSAMSNKKDEEEDEW